MNSRNSKPWWSPPSTRGSAGHYQGNRKITGPLGTPFNDDGAYVVDWVRIARKLCLFKMEKIRSVLFYQRRNATVEINNKSQHLIWHEIF